jgi:hypothetical protein
MGKQAARAARAAVRAAVRAALVAGSLVAGLLCCRAAHAADRPTISIVPVAGDHAPADVRARISQSLAEGLIASGADISAAPDEATYLLRGRVEIEGRSYTLHLEMLDRKTGSVIASREDRCEICTEAEAFETANTAASTLKAIVFKRPPGAGAAGATPPAGAAGATPPTGTAAAPKLASGTPALGAPGSAGEGTSAPGASLGIGVTAAPSERHTTLGWTGVATGLAAGVAGAILIGVDGDGTCPDYPAKACLNEYQTRTGGIALVAGGVVAIAVGVLALLGKI